MKTQSNARNGWTKDRIAIASIFGAVMIFTILLESGVI
jgi:hypothetical protein